jgi:hypothetical protein
VIGRVRRAKIAANMAITPPSLFGIERKIA